MGTYLGQNFLTDGKIRHRIADRVGKMYRELWAECLIEIWPWKGSLTKLIKDISEDFVVFEKDETLKERLEEVLEGKGKIVWGDVLETVRVAPWEGGFYAEKTLVVWNLPYYITSPILRKFFEPPSRGKNKGIVGGIFMVQDEVGEKVRFDAKKKSYLYWVLNYAYKVEYLRGVPAKAFSPAPKVRSCVISLVKKPELPQLSFERLVEFLDLFSPYSRKTLGKIAKMVEKRSAGASFLIPEKLAGKRLEELSWKELEGFL